MNRNKKANSLPPGILRDIASIGPGKAKKMGLKELHKFYQNKLIVEHGIKSGKGEFLKGMGLQGLGEFYEVFIAPKATKEEQKAASKYMKDVLNDHKEEVKEQKKKENKPSQQKSSGETKGILTVSLKLYSKLENIEGSIEKIAKDIGYVKSRVSPKTFTAKSGHQKTQQVTYDPLAPTGEQFRQTRGSGTLKPGKEFMQSAKMQAALIAKTDKGLLSSKFEDPKEPNSFKLARAELDSMGDSPLDMVRKESDKNFKMLFEILEDNQQQNSSGIKEMGGILSTLKGLGPLSSLIAKAGLVGLAGFIGYKVGSYINEKLGLSRKLVDKLRNKKDEDSIESSYKAETSDIQKLRNQQLAGSGWGATENPGVYKNITTGNVVKGMDLSAETKKDFARRGIKAFQKKSSSFKRKPYKLGPVPKPMTIQPSVGRDMVSAAADEAGIEGSHKAQLLAQLDHESGGFKFLEENLNYSPQRLMQVFPKYYSNSEDAMADAGNPVSIAETVYGGRMGNTAEGDGWKYRGRGFIQLTGKNNYDAFSRITGVDLTNNPDAASDPSTAARLAVAFYKKKVMDAGIDGGDTSSVTKAINGGLNGISQRESLFSSYLSGLGFSSGGGSYSGYDPNASSPSERNISLAGVAMDKLSGIGIGQALPAVGEIIGSVRGAISSSGIVQPQTKINGYEVAENTKIVEDARMASSVQQTTPMIIQQNNQAPQIQTGRMPLPQASPRSSESAFQRALSKDFSHPTAFTTSSLS